MKMTHAARSRGRLGAALTLTAVCSLALFPNHAAASVSPIVSLAAPAINTTYAYGQAVNLTAIVTGVGVTPTGIVQFGTIAFTPLVGIPGTASAKAITTATPPSGTYLLTAAYSGDGVYSKTTSANSVTITVARSSTSVTVVSSRNPSAKGQVAIFTASVSSSRVVCPTGTVSFSDGGRFLGQGTLGGSGPCQQVSLSTSSLSVGSHSIVGTYSGDSNFTGSPSPPFPQQVTAAPTPTPAPTPPPTAKPGPSISPPPTSAPLPTLLTAPAPAAATPAASPSTQSAPVAAAPTPPANRPFGSAPNTLLPASILDTSAVPPIAVLSMVSGIKMGTAPQIILLLLTFNILVLGAIFIASRRGRDLTRRSLTGHS